VRSEYVGISVGKPGPMMTTEGGARHEGLEKFVVEADDTENADLFAGWNGDSGEDNRRTYS
jgi:hypothetical protein